MVIYIVFISLIIIQFRSEKADLIRGATGFSYYKNLKIYQKTEAFFNGEINVFLLSRLWSLVLLPFTVSGFETMIDLATPYYSQKI